MIIVSPWIVIGTGIVFSSSTVSCRARIIGGCNIAVFSVIFPSFLFFEGESFAFEALTRLLKQATSNLMPSQENLVVVETDSMPLIAMISLFIRLAHAFGSPPCKVVGPASLSQQRVR